MLKAPFYLNIIWYKQDKVNSDTKKTYSLTFFFFEIAINLLYISRSVLVQCLLLFENVFLPKERKSALSWLPPHHLGSSNLSNVCGSKATWKQGRWTSAISLLRSLSSSFKYSFLYILTHQFLFLLCWSSKSSLGKVLSLNLITKHGFIQINYYFLSSPSILKNAFFIFAL